MTKKTVRAFGTNTKKAYLAFGTNLGNKEQNIVKAYEMIEANVGVITARSAFFYSKPWGFSSDNDFVNTVVCCETALTPRQLLEATQRIEREMGRSVKSINGEYHDRIIDIDILLYGDENINEPDLIIPHPLMNERDFVMVPLREVMGEYKH